MNRSELAGLTAFFVKAANDTGARHLVVTSLIGPAETNDESGEAVLMVANRRREVFRVMKSHPGFTVTDADQALMAAFQVRQRGHGSGNQRRSRDGVGHQKQGGDEAVEAHETA